jgi:superfamily I DNA/RNA helicase
MIRRVERIVANVMRERAAAMSDAIVWAGTFHAVGARLLREGRAQEEAPRDPTACLRCHAVLLL